MRRQLRRIKRALKPLGTLLSPALVLLVVLFFAGAVDHFDADRASEACRRLERTIRQGCVACYAAEGRYPMSLDDLRERYGLQVDESRYVVFYEAAGANLMPSITVLERQS